MHHLLPKFTAKALLILALHASVTFDAWTTIRVQNEPFPAHFQAVEDDPLMRPFARGNAMYPAINLLPLPIDLAILRAKSRKAKAITYGIAVAAIAMEIVVARRNLNLYSLTKAQYQQQFICSGCKMRP